jgi:hypothetical protein
MSQHRPAELMSDGKPKGAPHPDASRAELFGLAKI